MRGHSNILPFWTWYYFKSPLSLGLGFFKIRVPSGSNVVICQSTVTLKSCSHQSAVASWHLPDSPIHQSLLSPFLNPAQCHTYESPAALTILSTNPLSPAHSPIHQCLWPPYAHLQPQQKHIPMCLQFGLHAALPQPRPPSSCSILPPWQETSPSLSLPQFPPYGFYPAETKPPSWLAMSGV